MRRLLLTLALVLLCGPAAALTLTVRSGEHDGFSRLVIPLPPGVDWTLSQQGRGAEIRLTGDDILLGLGQIFERIPRHRIGALSQAGPGAPLRIALGCNCRVEAVMLEDRRLVIDVKDGTSPLPDPPARAVRAHPGGTPALRFGVATAQTQDVPGFPSLFRANTPRPAPSMQPPLPEAGTYPWAGAGGQLPVLLDRGGNRFSSEPARRLRENIDVAVHRGLLEESGTHSRHEDHHAPPAQHAGARADVAPDAAPGLARPGLNVENTIDLQLAEIRKTLRQQDSGTLCIADDRLAVQTWGRDDIDFGAQIGAWQRRLFGEFDLVDPQAQLGLARGYIHFGYGAEAASVLRLSPDLPGNSELLPAMAQIVDGRPLAAANPFAGQHVCGGNAALWALLAAGRREPETNDDAVLRTLGTLPRHLRHLFGPRIARLYADAGAAEQAELSLRLTGPDDGRPVPGAALARAELHRQQGKAPGRELAELARSGRDQAPEALIGVIGDAWAKGTAPPPQTAELAAGYALQHRGSGLGPALQVAHIRALALEGAFAAAFAELARYLPPASGGETAPAIRAGLLDRLAERAGDVEFIELLLANTGPESGPLPLPTVETLARRLLDLGFTAEAQDLLRGNVTGTPPDGIALIEAEIALALIRPHRALAILDRRGGAQAEALRAQALRLIGDHAGAAAHFAGAGQPAEAARSRWLAGGGAGADPAQDDESAGAYAAVARIAHDLGTAPDIQRPATPIAGAEMLLEQSKNAREGIAELFEALSVQD
ncbi:hypothetical protein [Pontibaca methylaminivorans]|uniref:Uncharacterized protein n=1 Tax=Pontibaca methylaminivorans TaxID=515897 RepID=A0A1R3WE88_9RHOB|nr:hypothetical protein [Pontibaca methylaminivorans]SIT75474.1 hypothetical protein SAMN05421849_0333 [Pontibaca methylaminivorans]